MPGQILSWLWGRQQVTVWLLSVALQLLHCCQGIFTARLFQQLTKGKQAFYQSFELEDRTYNGDKKIHSKGHLWQEFLRFWFSWKRQVAIKTPVLYLCGDLRTQMSSVFFFICSYSITPFKVQLKNLHYEVNWAFFTSLPNPIYY